MYWEDRIRVAGSLPTGVLLPSRLVSSNTSLWHRCAISIEGKGRVVGNWLPITMVT